jgi:hypothetical protein
MKILLIPPPYFGVRARHRKQHEIAPTEAREERVPRCGHAHKFTQ